MYIVFLSIIILLVTNYFFLNLSLMKVFVSATFL